MLTVLIPDWFPRLELRQFQLLPGHAAFVEVMQVTHYHFIEGIPVIFRYQFLSQLLNGLRQGLLS